MNRYLAFIVLLAVLTACHPRQAARPQDIPQESTPVPEQESAGALQNQNLQRTIAAEGFSSKGSIQAMTEVPVYSRINEQIVGFDIVLGQRVRKGEVVARLSRTVLED